MFWNILFWVWVSFNALIVVAGFLKESNNIKHKKKINKHD